MDCIQYSVGHNGKVLWSWYVSLFTLELAVTDSSYLQTSFFFPYRQQS